MKFTAKKDLLNRWIPLGLVLLWGVVQAIMYHRFGPHTAVDSRVYLHDAGELMRGRLPAGYSIWYVGYSLFLAGVQLLGGGIKLAVALQIGFSGGAAVGLWLAVRHLRRSVATAHLAVFLYLIWFKIHHWNVFIYTECVFTSCCICCFALLVLARRPWHLAAAVGLIAYTFLLRPNGYCFLVGVAGYGLLKAYRFVSASRWWWLAGAVLTVCLLVLLNRMLASYILVESYARAEIIYPGVTLGVVAPVRLTIPAEHYAPLVRLAAFVLMNPLYFGKLFLLKLLLFLSNVKPYFSWAHNVAVAVVLWPLYFFAFRGWRLMPPRCPAAWLIAGFVGAQALTVALTTENWDGRFLVPILPFVFVLAAVGLRGKSGPQIVGRYRIRQHLAQPLRHPRRETGARAGGEHELLQACLPSDGRAHGCVAQR